MILSVHHKKVKFIKPFRLPPMKSSFGTIKPLRDMPLELMWGENGRRIYGSPTGLMTAKKPDESINTDSLIGESTIIYGKE